MYPWLVFLHLVGIFGFLLAHGTSATVAFKLRGERERERVQALLDLSKTSLYVAYGSLLLLLVTGIVAGFTGHWWGTIWIWASGGVLVGMGLGMGLLGTQHYDRVRAAVGLPGMQGGQKDPPPEPASPEELKPCSPPGGDRCSSPWLASAGWSSSSG